MTAKAKHFADNFEQQRHDEHAAYLHAATNDIAGSYTIRKPLVVYAFLTGAFGSLLAAAFLVALNPSIDRFLLSGCLMFTSWALTLLAASYRIGLYEPDPPAPQIKRPRREAIGAPPGRRWTPNVKALPTPRHALTTGPQATATDLPLAASLKPSRPAALLEAPQISVRANQDGTETTAPESASPNRDNCEITDTGAPKDTPSDVCLANGKAPTPNRTGTREAGSSAKAVAAVEAGAGASAGAGDETQAEAEAKSPHRNAVTGRDRPSRPQARPAEQTSNPSVALGNTGFSCKALSNPRSEDRSR